MLLSFWFKLADRSLGSKNDWTDIRRSRNMRGRILKGTRRPWAVPVVAPVFSVVTSIFNVVKAYPSSLPSLH